MLIVWIAAATAVIIALIILFTSRGRTSAAAKNLKVVKLKTARSIRDKQAAKAARGKQQPCSLCRKLSSRLGFFTDENGRILGVCHDCKPKIKNRQLDQL
ncbi:hypothetical protein [Paenibacillus herberti]|uniref:Uncharacterized protein n=1 Tax=Paenibacillus herberti TaxID=1619309 RepID=A0A229P283_9BACL|nr:hypothetical protein [Paenibacillus herberti]OXM16210.1 hypothetical protein CGZ75_05820 [Paenibacillus herberti]